MRKGLVKRLLKEGRKCVFLNREKEGQPANRAYSELGKLTKLE